MKHRRGISTVVGAVFAIIALASVIGYITYSMNILDNYNQSVLVKSQQMADIANEKFTVSAVTIVNNKMNLTVVNTGSLPVNFTKIWITDKSATGGVQNYVPNTCPSSPSTSPTPRCLVAPAKTLINLGQDAPNNRVQKFLPTLIFSSKFGSFGTGDGQFSSLSSIKFDGSGNIYVTDSANNRVEKFNSAGTFQGWLGKCTSGSNCDTVNQKSNGFSCTAATCSGLGSGSGNGQFSNPQGIAFDSFGNIYVVDSGNSRFQKFTSAGTYTSQLGSFGNGNSNFNSPQGIAIDGSNNIYVVDSGNSRVQKYTSTYIWSLTIGSSGSGNAQFSSPSGIAFNSTGYIFITDTGNNRVQKFTSAGVYSSQFGSLGVGNSNFNSPRGIAVDGSNNIFVVDSGNNRVQKFNPQGVYSSQFGSFGTADGQFGSPQNVAFDGSGNIYVTEQSLNLNPNNPYHIKLVTSRGNTNEFDINSASTAPLNIQFLAIPPTVSQGFKTELIMVVTNNGSSVLTNVTPNALPSPSLTGAAQCSAAQVSSPPSYNTLAPGGTAIFTWDVTNSAGGGGDTCTYNITQPLQNGYLQTLQAKITVTVVQLSSTTYSQNSGIVTMDYTSFKWVQGNTWNNDWQFPSGVVTAFQVTFTNNNQTSGGYYLNMSKNTEILLTPTLGNTAASAHVPYAFYLVGNVNTGSNPYTMTTYTDYSQGIANLGGSKTLYFGAIAAGGNTQTCSGNNNNCLPPGQYYGLMTVYGKYWKGGAFSGTYAQTLSFMAVVAS